MPYTHHEAVKEFSLPLIFSSFFYFFLSFSFHVFPCIVFFLLEFAILLIWLAPSLHATPMVSVELGTELNLILGWFT